MASITSLNNQMLYRVFFYVAGYHAVTLSQWKQKLFLLHVCKRWTEIAQALVLREGFVEIAYKQPWLLQKLVRRRPRARTRSNTQILIDRMYFSQVHHMHVKAYGTRDYTVFFDAFLQALGANRFEWVGVEKLIINMAVETKDMYLVDKKDLTVPSGKICEEYGERVYGCMRGVRHLEIQEPLITESHVATSIVEKYLDQLCYLHCSNPLAVSERYFPNFLNYLHLSMDPNSQVCFLPQLRAEPLESLLLSNIPRSFSWMEFYDAKGKDVVFANLRNLVLSFQLAKGEERARGPRKKIVSFQLHFPCLRNLTLRDCPEDSELYGCDRYFGDLEKVKVWGSVDSLEAMKALGLKKTSSLDVVIVDDQDDDGKKHDRVYGVAKHYLGTTSSSSKRLFVTANLDYIEYRGIDWSGLSLLALYDTVRFDQVLNFINGIPSLSSFHVLCASFEGVVRDNSEASDGDSSDGDDSTVLERLSPLLPGSMLSLATDNTEVSAGMAIRELSLCFDEEAAYSDRFKARVAGYMIELLPSLQHLYVEPSLQRYLCRKKSEAGAAVYEQPRASIRYADHRALRAYVTDLISQQ